MTLMFFGTFQTASTVMIMIIIMSMINNNANDSASNKEWERRYEPSQWRKSELRGPVETVTQACQTVIYYSETVLRP